MKRKNLLRSLGVLIALFLMQASVAFAAPVYIDVLADFPAYPYNTSAYKVNNAFVGCGPTTGAMILGYFQHHYGLTGLLDSPGAGVNEGLNTAWALHGASYMNTGADGFGPVLNIKPGLENYAADRGFQVKVMIRAATTEDPATSTYNQYGAYGDAWTNDGVFWQYAGGVWDINRDLFCDFVGSKLASGVAVMLTVDSDNVEGGDHWIPCVGVDKATGVYYCYDTYSTTLQSKPIAYAPRTPTAGDYAITLVRTIEFKQEFSLENAKSWYWNSYTYISSVARGDVDGDAQVEIVTGGHYYDGTRYVAQLCVWNGATLALENIKTWYWTGTTYIWSVMVGNVDGDGQVEIVTGGTYYDGTRTVAQLCVWNGATLASEKVQTWYWTGNTEIWSVSYGNVDGDGSYEIVTGGNYYDGTRTRAQLCVWNGATLALENVQSWYWTGNTNIRSVAVANVDDGDAQVEIVTGGYYYDGTRNVAQLCVWTGTTLAVEDIRTWYWTSNTAIFSVAVGNVDGDGALEIVTGGGFNDGTRVNSQLCVWTAATLALEKSQSWYWTGNTQVWSVGIGDVDGDGALEIVTGGSCRDGIRDNGQVVVWNAPTLAMENVKTWYWTGNTIIYAVAVGDVNGDAKLEIVTGGNYNDGTRDVAQLIVWA